MRKSTLLSILALALIGAGCGAAEQPAGEAVETPEVLEEPVSPPAVEEAAPAEAADTTQEAADTTTAQP